MEVHVDAGQAGMGLVTLGVDLDGLLVGFDGLVVFLQLVVTEAEVRQGDCTLDVFT